MNARVKTVQGGDFAVSPGQSVLDAALQSGYVFEYSCKNGQCGVCKTKLRDGQVIEIQPQLALTAQDAADDCFLSCCCTVEDDTVIEAEDLRALKGIDVQTAPAKIHTLTYLTDELVEVVLRLPPRITFRFLAGQYVDVIGPDAVRRSYSCAQAPSDPHVRLLIKKVANGALSAYWFGAAKVGDLLRLEGPKGTFFVRDAARPLVFLATGTGIAPVISMLQALDQDETFQQTAPIYVLWGNRYPDDFAWALPDTKLDIVFIKVASRADGEWTGAHGYVQTTAVNVIKDFSGVSVYACGSAQMIADAKDALMANGLEENCFYSDAFVSSAKN